MLKLTGVTVVMVMVSSIDLTGPMLMFNPDTSETVPNGVVSNVEASRPETLEPIDQNIRGRAKPTFRKLLQGGNDTLRVFKVCVQGSSVPCSWSSD